MDKNERDIAIGEALTLNLIAVKGYAQLKYEFPVCNYTEEVNADNIGYAKGILEDGTPFVAEQYKNGGDLGLGIIIPAIFEYEYNAAPELPGQLEERASRLLKVEIPRANYDNSVLDIGMTDYGQEEDFDYIVAYAEYLCEGGLFDYKTNVSNASVFYRADETGNIFAKVLVSLVDNSEEVAFTGLEFKRFPNCKKPALKILK